MDEEELVDFMAQEIQGPLMHSPSVCAEGEEMDEDSDEEDFAEDGAGVPESAIVTVSNLHAQACSVVCVGLT